MLVCLNGTFVPHETAQLHINDAGFLFGDTLFETMKAHGRKILLQKEHLDRIELSAGLLDFPCQRQKIETSLRQLANALTATTSRIRLTISRGRCQGLSLQPSESSWYLLTATPYEEPSSTERTDGAACLTAPNQRVNPLSHLPQMKRGNYADCLYAADYARSRGAREALFSDPAGQLLEGSTSNLFAIRDKRLITPQVGSLVLAGIMRRQVIAAANEMGIPVEERCLPREELLNADEAFICNSLIDILPLSSLDGQPLKTGDLWQSLLNLLRVRIGT